jgi:hypothetical protein
LEKNYLKGKKSMKKLFVLFSVFCLIVGLSAHCMAVENLTIKGDVRVEYDNWLSTDTPAVNRTEQLYLERVMLNFTYDPGNNTTATAILRCNGDNGTMSSTGTHFHIYNAYINHSLMDNKLSIKLGKFNLHVPTVYGIRGPNTYSYAYFTEERHNGAMATFNAMPELAINFAIVDDQTNLNTASRPYTLYLKGKYNPMDTLNLFLALKSTPADDTKGDHVDDMELVFGAKYKAGKVMATLEYYQQMLDSVDDQDQMVINLGASYQATDQLKPYLAIESIDDGDVTAKDSGPELNVVAGAHYTVSENLTYALELDYTMDENSDVDDSTKVGLRARYTF